MTLVDTVEQRSIMRKKHIIWLATAGLIATAGGVLVLPGAMPASAVPSTRGGHQQVLHLTSQTEQFSVIDVGEKGPALGLGDQIVSSDRVLRNGRTVGRSGTVLTVVGVKPNVLTTQWLTIVELPEGQLVLQGIGDGPTGPPTVPLTVTVGVTGGTGVYATARGVVEIVDHPGGTEDLTVTLDN